MMFEVFTDTGDLVDRINLKTYIKYLRANGRSGPYYTCQFYGKVHKRDFTKKTS